MKLTELFGRHGNLAAKRARRRTSRHAFEFKAHSPAVEGKRVATDFLGVNVVEAQRSEKHWADLHDAGVDALVVCSGQQFHLRARLPRCGIERDDANPAIPDRS